MKQKSLSLVLSLLMVFIGQSAYAYDFEVDGIWYDRNSDGSTVTVAHCNFDVIKLVIPSTVIYEEKEYKVTSIEMKSASYYCYKFTSITIPPTIQSINTDFNSCTELEQVIVPDIESWCKIKFPGNHLFNPLSQAHHLYSDETTEITNLVIPNSVDSILDNVFSGCNALSSVTIPNSVKYIGNGAFFNCSKLKSISIPNSINEICNNAFMYCSSLTEVELNSASLVKKSYSSTRSDGLYLIFGTQVKKYILGDEVTVIGANAFKFCTNLTSIAISNSLKSIGDGAFCDCSGLTSITIPDKVTYIGESAFQNCSGLTSITIPNAVSRIGKRAFYGCNSLISIIIGESVNMIGSEAFSGCKSLREIELYSDAIVSEKHTDVSSNVFSEIFGSQVEKYVIGEGVKSIGDYTFYGCDLTSITIPTSLTQIGSNAFYGCYKIKKVIVPDIETWCNISFGNEVANPLYFAHFLYSDETTAITDLVIPQSITVVNSNAFNGCIYFTSVSIPSSLINIGSNAFNGCIRLEKVIVPDIETWCNISFGNEGANPLYFAHHLYSDTTTEITNLVIPSSVSNIGNYVFNGGKGFTSVTIPYSVTSIGNHAFSECTNLRTISIPNSVTSLGKNVLRGCTGLKDVVYLIETTADFFTQINADFWVLPSIANQYPDNNNIHSLYEYEATQSTITLESSILESAVFKTHKTQLANEKMILTGLMPETTYEVLLKGKVVDEEIQFHGKLQTKGMSLHVDPMSTTNHKIQVSAYYDGDPVVLRQGLRCDGQEIAVGENFTNLRPGQRYNVTYYVVANNEKEYTASTTCSTQPLDLYAEYTPGVTMCKGMVFCNPIDLTIEKLGFVDEGQQEVIWSDLEPNRYYEYSFFADTKESGRITGSASFNTKRLTLETQAAKATSDRKAVICALTNCDDEALRYGFEWRRYDAPEEMPSNVVKCPMYNGAIAGTLNNLSSTTYYKYRPFYQSAGGKMFYGDWVAFITADAYVYFEPEVHTYDVQNITENSAKVRGYVVTGSDDIEEQGFEYWSGSETAQTTQASGMMMTATLSELKSNTEYHCRSYVKTNKGTTYGEDVKFRTAVASSIEEPPVKSENSFRSFDIYTTNGLLVGRNQTTMPELPRGIYILKSGVQHKKVLIK